MNEKTIGKQKGEQSVFDGDCRFQEVDGFIVLELSSFQLETCNNLILDGAIILNIISNFSHIHLFISFPKN